MGTTVIYHNTTTAVMLLAEVMTGVNEYGNVLFPDLIDCMMIDLRWSDGCIYSQDTAYEFKV